jgi:hypothetical protein
LSAPHEPRLDRDGHLFVVERDNHGSDASTRAADHHDRRRHRRRGI